MFKNVPLINKILIPLLLVSNIYGLYFYKTNFNIEKEEIEYEETAHEGLRRLTDEELAALKKSIRIDVNRASYEDLITLKGVGPSTARAIIAYREKHGPFEYINDLENVSGIGPSLIEDIKDKVRTLKEGMREIFEDEEIRVDLIIASQEEIEKIPGIGSVTAAAIIDYRKSKGGRINTLNELTAIRGLTHATLKEISKYITRPRYDERAAAESSFPINVNRATKEDLMRVSGIGPSTADRIIEYRKGGRIRDLDELLNVRGIGPATLEKLKPYLTVR